MRRALRLLLVLAAAAAPAAASDEVTRALVGLQQRYLASTALAAPAADDDVNRAVAGLRQRYLAVRTVAGRFTQIYRAPGVEQTESGVVWMKKPGLMRWEYREPERKLFIADGRKTYLYTPEDRQVMVRAFSAHDLLRTPLSFLLGQGSLEERFRAERDPEPPKAAGGIAIRLVPREPQPEYEYVVAEVEPRAYDLRRLVVHEPTGNTSEFLFPDLATNVRIDDSQFQFRIPKGVEVIQLDEKQ